VSALSQKAVPLVIIDMDELFISNILFILQIIYKMKEPGIDPHVQGSDLDPLPPEPTAALFSSAITYTNSGNRTKEFRH